MCPVNTNQFSVSTIVQKSQREDTFRSPKFYSDLGSKQMLISYSAQPSFSDFWSSSLWSCLSPHPSLPYAEFLLPGKDLAILAIPFCLISFLFQPGLPLQFPSSKMTLKSPKFKSRIQDLLQSQRTERFMILCYHAKQMRTASAV